MKKTMVMPYCGNTTDVKDITFKNDDGFYFLLGNMLSLNIKILMKLRVIYLHLLVLVYLKLILSYLILIILNNMIIIMK